jgi:hypothetical protein
MSKIWILDFGFDLSLPARQCQALAGGDICHLELN